MALTVFDASNIFVTLSTTPFARQAPLARALQSVLLAPQGLSQGNGLQADPRPGFSADAPALIARPLQLSLDNVLLLSGVLDSLQLAVDETRTNLLAARNTLQGLLLTSESEIFNPAASFITAAQQVNAASATPARTSSRTPRVIFDPVEIDARFPDFSQRPKEAAAFGSTYASVAGDSTLNSVFEDRIALAGGESVLLSELVQGAANGSPTHYAISIVGENDGGVAGTLLDGGGTDLGTGVVLAAAELSTTRFQAADDSVGALDYLNIIELSDPGGDGTYDGRGSFRSVAISSNAAPADSIDEMERVRRFNFATEAGIAVPQLRLAFSGVNSAGFTDIESAIRANAAFVRVTERLPDGGTNRAVVDLYNSSGNGLVVKFAAQAAEDGLADSGITVEVRGNGPSFDPSTIQVRAAFA